MRKIKCDTRTIPTKYQSINGFIQKERKGKDNAMRQEDIDK